MSKTQYGISAVQYCSRNNRIENVQAHQMSDDNLLSNKRIYPREAVVKAIEEKGISFITLPPAHDGKFTIGAEVFVVEVGNEKFIKAIDNTTRDDNLGELPEFC